MVNDEIKQLNKDNSPTTVIQYVKQFDVINANKEKVTGGHINRQQYGLKGKLAFKPVDIAYFKVKTYPDFPDTNEVDSKIKSLCKGIYRDSKKQVRKIMGMLKKNDNCR